MTPSTRKAPSRPAHLIRLGIVTYVFALALIAAFTIAFHFLTDSIVKQQQNTAAIVNLSGRQRMLSQRIAKLSLERASHANFRPDAVVNRILTDSINTMASSHHDLLYGTSSGPAVGPATGEVLEVYQKAPWLLDQKMQSFLARARAVAAKPSASLNFTDPDLIAEQQEAQAPLLDALNAAVTANQNTSERSIKTLREVHTSLTLLMLIILMLEALFLYRPLFNKLARAHEALLLAGRTDPLTGCLNRRAFTSEAAHAITRVREQTGVLAVLMLDIDRFKSINDRYGHPVGDRVINSVVSIILNSIRDTDILCRMGGEEFAVMLPGQELSRASQAAERVRLAIENTPIPINGAGDTYLSITLSIGIAMLDSADATIFDLLGRADLALYRAKSAGRNRVESEYAEAPEAVTAL